MLHTTGGYLVFVSMTHQYVFDYHEGEVYWCTADVGWVTGPYILRAARERRDDADVRGRAHYPDASRFWQVIDKHKVNTFYTAPTAIRALMGAGDDFVTPRRALAASAGTVGEPINPEAWEVSPRGRRRSLPGDTWWQTETADTYHAAAWRDVLAGLGDAAVLRREAGAA